MITLKIEIKPRKNSTDTIIEYLQVHEKSISQYLRDCLDCDVKSWLEVDRPKTRELRLLRKKK